jgi:hypothetical protein
MTYLAYLLRIWSVDEEKHLGWRAYLQNPHTGERQAFASLEEMCAFLKEKTLYYEISDLESTTPDKET